MGRDHNDPGMGVLTKPNRVEQAMADWQALQGHGGPVSYAPLLPLLLTFENKPYDVMTDYFLHEPLFKLTCRPRRTLVRASRQVGKTLGMAAEMTLLAALIPGFKVMAAFPLQDQANWFSNNYIKPLIEQSPVIKLLASRGTQDAVYQKSFDNYGAIYFRYIGNGADRARGSRVDMLCVDECQDIDPRSVYVVEANMEASQYKLERFSGTAKTRDNPLEIMWDKHSSQGVWVTRCQDGACGHYNEAMGEGMLKMLGDWTLVCGKCGRPSLDTSLGWYQHRRPERFADFAGYHLPGPILPRCYRDPKEWAILKQRQRSLPPRTFMNEFLGESWDVGSKLITIEELKAACQIPWVEPRDADMNRYYEATLGVDWGGKGKEVVKNKDALTDEFISNTALAHAGIRADGRVEIPWLYAAPYSASYEEEARVTCQAAELLSVRFVAHDAGGGGDLRQSILLNMGWPLGKLAPFTYTKLSANRPIVFHIAPDREGVRHSWSVDKTRAIGMVIHLIKTGWILLPDWAKSEQFLMDFQHIFEETRDNPTGAPSRVIMRQSGQHDDVVHAIVFAVMALYHATGRWPDVAKSFVEGQSTGEQPVSLP